MVTRASSGGVPRSTTTDENLPEWADAIGISKTSWNFARKYLFDTTEAVSSVASGWYSKIMGLFDWMALKISSGFGFAKPAELAAHDARNDVTTQVSGSETPLRTILTATGIHDANLAKQLVSLTNKELPSHLGRSGFPDDPMQLMVATLSVQEKLVAPIALRLVQANPRLDNREARRIAHRIASAYTGVSEAHWNELEIRSGQGQREVALDDLTLARMANENDRSRSGIGGLLFAAYTKLQANPNAERVAIGTLQFDADLRIAAVTALNTTLTPPQQPSPLQEPVRDFMAKLNFDALNDGQKLTLVAAMNRVLGNNLSSPLTVENFGTATDALIAALPRAYPNPVDSLKVPAFIQALSREMPHDFPSSLSRFLISAITQPAERQLAYIHTDTTTPPLAIGNTINSQVERV